jgi:hypothetical protein
VILNGSGAYPAVAQAFFIAVFSILRSSFALLAPIFENAICDTALFLTGYYFFFHG